MDLFFAVHCNVPEGGEEGLLGEQTVSVLHRRFPFKRQIFKTAHGPKEQLSEFSPFLRGVRASHTVVGVFDTPVDLFVTAHCNVSEGGEEGLLDEQTVRVLLP